MTFRPRAATAITMWLLILAALAGYGSFGGIRVNLTRSYPLGLWRIEPLGRGVKVGDRIFICPPQTAAFQSARERGYLGHGACPGWYSPLIKTVVAVGGQHVVIDGSIAVDGVRLPNSSILPIDGKGRALGSASSGVVPTGRLFLLSEFTGSYDSRYFGPIPAAGVLGFARPILVFSP